MRLILRPASPTGRLYAYRHAVQSIRQAVPPTGETYRQQTCRTVSKTGRTAHRQAVPPTDRPYVPYPGCVAHRQFILPTDKPYLQYPGCVAHRQSILPTERPNSYQNGCTANRHVISPQAVGAVHIRVHRNRRLIRDGRPGRPPRLSHSS